MTKILVLICALTIFPFLGLGQNPVRDQEEEKITVGRNEVLIDAVIKDKKGRAIKDLAATDFEIYEDGVRQQVESFRLVTRGAEAEGDSGDKSKKPRQEPGTASANLPVEGVPAVALVFDRLSPDGRARARDAALSYIGKEQSASDFIGVFAVDLSLHVLQPFTTNRQLVRAAIENASSQSSSSFASNSEEVRRLSERQAVLERAADSTSGTDARDATAIAEQSLNQMSMQILETFERMERDQQGYATTNGLLAVVNSMRRIEGRKAIIFLSEGIAIPPNVQQFFRSVISNANRANVSVYTVDAAGLRAQSSLDETRNEVQAIATRRQRQVASGLEDRSGQPMSRVLERNEDVLMLNPESGLGQLADQTGGFLVSKTNDPGARLRQVNDDLHTYYVLSYVPKNQSYDGRFRQIDLKLHRSGVEVQMRKGYYAINSIDASPVLAYEASALAALNNPNRPSSFPLYADGFNFPAAEKPDLVSVIVEVPPGVVTYVRDSGKLYRTDFSIVALIRDGSRRVVRKLSNQYALSEPADQIEKAKRGEILFYREAGLPPGKYTIDVAAVDAIANKSSVISGSFEVASGDTAKLRMSSLAILKRAEQIPPDQSKSNPFKYGEVLVYPNLGEELHKATDKQLAFFLTAYAARGKTAAPRLTIEVKQQGSTLSRALVVLPPPDNTGRIQYASALSIEKLPPGDYELTATVSDGASSATRSKKFRLQ